MRLPARLAVLVLAGGLCALPSRPLAAEALPGSGPEPTGAEASLGAAPRDSLSVVDLPAQGTEAVPEGVRPVDDRPLLSPEGADTGLLPSAGCIQVPDRGEVRDLVAEFTGPQRQTFAEGLRRSGRYLPMILDALEEAGLPADVAYLPLVESHFQWDARSPSGALGLWQFMEATAREYGLRVDPWVDERLDPEASTRAAVRHIADLYDRFGAWDLATAAYNAGPNGVARAMAAAGAESFWDLYDVGGLRAQTCRYVVKFLAALAIAADPKAHGVEPAEQEAPVLYDTIWVDSPVDLATLARLLAAPVETLRSLNPALRQDRTPPGSELFPVRVPQGKGTLAAQELAALPRDQRLGLVRYKVRRGETLSKVARRHGVSAGELAAANSLGRGATLRAGQELRIPPKGLKSAAAESDTRPVRGVHVVSRGETVWAISARYGVKPADVLRWNGRRKNEVLRAGERLVVSASTAGGAAVTRR